MLEANIKFKKKWSDRGVSEVIGTILMLAITVVLFSTIMVSVMSLPAPQQRPNADFLATLAFQSGNTAYLNITHIGGETLFAASARIIVIKDVTNSATYTLSDGGVTGDWDISEMWSKQLSDVTTSTRVEATVVDLDTNSMIWSSLVTGGQQSLYPQILQRWVDANPSTLTIDPIRESNTSGFTFYVRVIDADYDLSDNGVWVDASSVGKSNHLSHSAVRSGVWEFEFSAITDASYYDGKPLFIHAVDDAGHESIDSYVLSVLQPDVFTQYFPTEYIETPAGEGGLPSYLVYVHGDQGYVVLGENKTPPRTWGAYANISDPKFTFTQGEEWCFIRVGTKNLRNLEGKNSLEIRGIYTNQLVTPPSNTSAFSIYTVSGPAYIYQAKFNTSLLTPGMYSVFIDLLSTAVEGATPSRFQANFVLTILAPAGQENAFMPSLKFYKEDRRVNPGATEWGTKTSPFDLSSVSTSIVWVEIGLQTIGAASSASVNDIRITDMRARANLYGDAPSGDNMISSVSADASNKVYYISIDLRLRNGVTYTSGLSAYSITIGKIFDADEGIYTISLPIWIRSSSVSRNFVVATDGFGFGKPTGTDNFLHDDYLFHIDNNKFFTTRVIDYADEDPGGGSVISPYLSEYFDIDEDGDRDVLAANAIRGSHYLTVYINRMNEYGIWEPRSIFTNYTDTSASILSMAHGDVDNDGDEDWIVSTSAGKVYLYLNDFPVKTKTLFTTGNLRYLREMRLADITGDGRADLIAIGYSSSVARGDTNCRLYLYNLTRDGAVTTSPYDLGNYPATNRDLYDFDIGDIDGDGDIDIAVVADYADGGYGVRWYERKETETVPGALATGDPISYTGVRVSGTYTNTQSSDNSYEVIQESSNDLDYAWPVATISGERATLYFEARMSSGADENFYVYYGKTATGPWVFMFMVPSTATVDTTYSFQLPSGTSGTIYVRVADSASSDSSDDSIYIDRINVRGVTAVSYSTLHGLYASTSYIAIGIGDMDGFGNLDVAVAKGSGGSGGEIVVINGTSGTALTTIAYATLAPTGDKFVVRDTNGDGRAEIVSVEYANSDITRLRMWLNLGYGTSFSNILVKDFYASYGNKGGQTIMCINVENQYGE
ncbi:MAG: FG-GAP-like repeat-containing protein [Thermoplasmata archaeon]